MGLLIPDEILAAAKGSGGGRSGTAPVAYEDDQGDENQQEEQGVNEDSAQHPDDQCNETPDDHEPVSSHLWIVRTIEKPNSPPRS